MPSLKKFHNEMKLSFKETFTSYIRTKYGKNADELIYMKIRKIIHQVCLLHFFI